MKIVLVSCLYFSNVSFCLSFGFGVGGKGFFYLLAMNSHHLLWILEVLLLFAPSLESSYIAELLIIP